MPETGPDPKASESPTRTALIEAALHLFGRKGYDAASTREIAARAGANVAAIAYHFGGKAGLRMACVEAISAQLDGIVPAAAVQLPETPAEAQAALEAILRAAVRFLAAAGPAQDFAVCLLREITMAGPLVDTIYGEIIAPRHRILCRLWGLATGQDPESEPVRLTVFAMMGQAIYFRIGQPMILRRMGWQAIDPARADRIADLLVETLRAALAASERNAT
jgi:AcrR family transcriptional regulator